MWREYVRMELGFIERMRRRWDVLGIEGKGGEKRKGKARDDGGRSDEEEDAEMEVEEGVAVARNDIMQGAIVRSVISSAAQGMCAI
jgi:U3 small nucleolar RNA-associated protein 6